MSGGSGEEPLQQQAAVSEIKADQLHAGYDEERAVRQFDSGAERPGVATVAIEIRERQEVCRLASVFGDREACRQDARCRIADPK